MVKPAVARNAPSVIANVAATRPRLAAANPKINAPHLADVAPRPAPAARSNGRIRCFAAGVAVGAIVALVGVALQGGGL